MLKQWYSGLHKILQGCHGHGKVMDFLEFMEKLWNFGQKLTGSWKSHGIFKLEQKVMEFYKQILNSHESAPLHGSFSKSKRCVFRLRGHGIL